MIDGEAFERAENTLKVVYGGDLGRQLSALEVDRDALDNVLEHCRDVIDRRYREARHNMDPRLEAGYMTMIVHMFLVGLIAGRNSLRVIE